MARRLSRRKVADVVADRLLQGDPRIVQELAAYLVETKSVKDVDVYVRDIEAALQQKGHLLARVTTAFELEAHTREQLVVYLQRAVGATTVELAEQRDPAILGGLHVKLPGAERDTTVARQLTKLKTQFIKA